MKDMNKLEIVYVAVEKIKPYANNPRINKKAVEKVMKSIQAYGFKVPCVLDKNYLLITGHTRWEAAKRLKMKRIPCIIASDLNKAKADAFRIADNKVAEYSTWDMTKLKEELSKIQLEDIEFDDMGFDNDFSIEKLGLVDMPEGSDGDEGEIETEKYSTKTNIPQYEIQGLIKKYSNYITYPIKMEVTHQHLKEKVNPDDKDEYETVTHDEVINDLIPIWKRNQKDIKDEEYDTFYSDKFFDYEKPIRHIHTKAEGTLEFRSLIYIPSHMPYDYYTKEYEKGLQLYSNGVLIMEKCPDLVPDYLSFIKGVVDSSDLPLNISRETIQQNRILATISKNIETKVLKELEDMQKNAREDYIKFYNAFGMQLKYGVYNDYGMNKDKLKDLLMFHSSKDKQFVTLKEYTERMEKEQKNIYYACGETVDKVDLIPQVEAVKNKGYEVLYCTDYVDEFAIKMLNKYADKEFKNVCTDSLELDSEEEIEKLKKKNEKSKDMFNIMKEAIPEIKDIRFTNKLSNHPVCLSSAGEISVEMEKALNSMPIDNKISAEKVLEINEKHKIAKKLNELYKEDKKTLKKYAKVLYAQARLIEGLSIENPTEISNLMTEIMSK